MFNFVLTYHQMLRAHQALDQTLLWLLIMAAFLTFLRSVTTIFNLSRSSIYSQHALSWLVVISSTRVFRSFPSHSFTSSLSNSHSFLLIIIASPLGINHHVFSLQQPIHKDAETIYKKSQTSSSARSICFGTDNHKHDPSVVSCIEIRFYKPSR